MLIALNTAAIAAAGAGPVVDDHILTPRNVTHGQNVDYASFGPRTERRPPITILQQTNLSGTVADIDDDPDAPDSPDTALLAISDAADVDLVVTFDDPEPTNKLDPTPGAQEFRVRARRSRAGGSNPLLEIYVRDAGVEIGSPSVIGGGLVNADDGVIFSALWDALDRPGGSPQTVECRVKGNFV